jgi:hypothetical protein
LGDEFVAVTASAIEVRLGLLGKLGGACFRVREDLLTFAPDGLRLPLGILDDALRRSSGILLDLVRVTLRARDVLLGCPLREGQHLQGLLLNLRGGIPGCFPG